MTKGKAHNPRAGTTSLEFAMVVPIVFLLFAAAFEFSRMSMLKHSVRMAAYEGARRGIVPGASVSDVVSRSTQILGTVGTRNATVTVSPNPFTSQTNQITVNIRVPLNDNSWVPPFFLREMQLDSSFTMGRENVSWGLASQPPSVPPTQQLLVAPQTADDKFNGGNKNDDDKDDDDKDDKDKDD